MDTSSIGVETTGLIAASSAGVWYVGFPDGLLSLFPETVANSVAHGLEFPALCHAIQGAQGLWLLRSKCFAWRHSDPTIQTNIQRQAGGMGDTGDGDKGVHRDELWVMDGRVESLYCTPDMNIMVCVNYTGIKASIKPPNQKQLQDKKYVFMGQIWPNLG